MSASSGSLRGVLLALGLTVVIVLGTQLLTILLPPLGQAVRLAPILIIVLVLVTALMLVRALRA